MPIKRERGEARWGQGTMAPLKFIFMMPKISQIFYKLFFVIKLRNVTDTNYFTTFLQTANVVLAFSKYLVVSKNMISVIDRY